MDRVNTAISNASCTASITEIPKAYKIVIRYAVILENLNTEIIPNAPIMAAIPLTMI